MLVKKQHPNTNVLVSNDSLQTAYQPSQPVLPVQVSSYPLQGITYFATHPSLWCRFIFHLTIAVILVLVVIVLLFVFAFPAQAIAFARFVPQGWAWTISVFLCIVESAVATILVGLIYLQAIALDDIFDIVMRHHGYDFVHTSNQHGFKRGIYRFLHPILYFLMTLVCLPLNLVPILGNYLFFLCVAYFVSWGCHMHYFDSKFMSWHEAKDYVKKNWKNYLAFGYVGALLEGIPLFGLFFMMTNVIGAALWAVELEKSGMAPQFVGVANIQNPIAQGQQSFSGVSQKQSPYSQPTNSSQPALSPREAQLQQHPPTTYQGVPPMEIQPVTNYYGPSPVATAHNQISQATNNTNQIVANTQKQNLEIQIIQSPSSSTQRNLPYGHPSTQTADSIPTHQHYGPTSINQPFVNHWSSNSSQPHVHQQQSNTDNQEPPPPYNNPFANG